MYTSKTFLEGMFSGYRCKLLKKELIGYKNAIKVSTKKIADSCNDKYTIAGKTVSKQDCVNMIKDNIAKSKKRIQEIKDKMNKEGC